ncbi:Ankyrin repeats (3 copies) [Vibrio ruber DSM 16370]|uniref:Ankyrin repeats (3 copies) n=1 Tax=Vibrio ruber (strain DSM 16370 / JCM 11486 / BCRC 17186 / CECT 7878 / LMG 23124 / VR1) TaxID=1123498 RepID=A0A1R4LTA7_VIBR1|nr:ankyrin repeat domain-containing protein [Vibrio ruber]SJN59831.1 Ankyrin repeats (3 copies) [Vibrio ruber DSM 16370]
MKYTERPEYKLFKALRNGQIQQAETLIKDGADIHRISESEKWSYLHKILMSTSTDPEESPPIESVQYLIDQGLDVNAIDSYGYTPLIYAVRQRNVEGIRLLLENGADKLIEHRGIDSINALRMAFRGKPFVYDVVKLLLDFGADPDAKTEKGKSVRELVNLLDDMDPKIIELVSHY